MGYLLADSISCEVCDSCSGVHVNFHDETGEIFASATVPASSGKKFIAHFRECLRITGRFQPAPQGRQ